ncbi:MAG: sulfatase-like hydrolase/transferase [Chitinivibrionales bacterium]|nr:sulfatase-like hydrolase/transferase [Chitinivibrionales bacterium]
MPSRARPNILWISFEDTYPYYGCYGDPVARTPNVDRLASQGCRWTNAFSTAGVCAPARSAVITGMYPISVGTHHMRTTHTNSATPELPTPYSAVVPHYVKCFTEYLRAEGYYCTNNVKTDYQFACPVTAWDELSESAHWRNRPDPAQPFFAVFNPTKTHESGMWPEKCPNPTFDPNDMILPPYFPDTPKVREAMARMYTNIEHCDGIMGELLAQLEEDGLTENTLVFHWSDHGPLPRGKRWPYDSGIRVPLIVRWPGGLDAGSVTDEPVSTIDLGPTVLSLAGVDIPAHMQGQAFLGPQAKPSREYVYASRDRYDESYDMVRAVRDTRYKYIRNYHPELPYLLWIPYRNRHPIVEEMWRLYAEGSLEGAQLLMFQPRRPVEELYDTKDDPYEIHNIAADPAQSENLNRLREALDDWLAEVGDLGEVPESEMVRQWYPDGVQPRTAPPTFVPICEGASGVEAVQKKAECREPALLQLHCATQGASIAYTCEAGEDVRWLLYGAPIRLEPGETTVRAKAIRIGYAESEERSVTFTVLPRRA